MVLQLLSLWMKSCDGETINPDMALLVVISHMVLYLNFHVAFHTPPAGLKMQPINGQCPHKWHFDQTCE